MLTPSRRIGFMDRMHRGWELTKASLRVVKQDKHLMVFPILAGIGLIMAFAGFGGLLAWLHFTAVVDDVTYAVIALTYYFVSYFITIYFNTALVVAVKERLDARTPTIGGGLRGANSRLGAILGWTLVAATVGLILQILQNAARDQRNLIGQILAQLAGVAWSVITYFVIPVIVAERHGPIAAVKESARTMKRTWGESLAGTFSMGFIFFLFQLPALLLLFLAFYVGGTSIMLALALIVIAALWFLTVMVIQATAKQVLVASLYRYAKTGDAGGVMSRQQAEATFNPNAQWVEFTDPETGRIRGA